MGEMRWSTVRWEPVPVKGFGEVFEMSPQGFVRRVLGGDDEGGHLWLLPVTEGDGPFYRLRHEGLGAELYVRRIFKAFGVPGRVDCGWVQRARERALAENAFVLGEANAWEAALQSVRAGGEIDLEMLVLTLNRGCPWEKAIMAGDARGADPVLGF